MEKKIHLYKLLFDSKLGGFPVPRSIIKGFGFQDIVFMGYENLELRFRTVRNREVSGLVESWKVDRAVLKQNNAMVWYSKGGIFANEYVLQEWVEDAREVVVSWDYCDGFNADYRFSECQKDCVRDWVDLIRRLVNKEISLVNCKLSKIEVSFLVNFEGIYCLGIHSYSYAPFSLTNEANLKKNDSNSRSKKTSNIKRNIDRAISDINNKRNSIRNIKYQVWVSKVKRGENPLPTEDYFTRKLVKTSRFNEKKSVECIGDLKLLSMKLRVSLSSNKLKSQLSEGIRAKLETVLNSEKVNYMINKHSSPKETLESLSEISLKTAKNLIKSSAINLNLFSKHRLSK